MNIAIKNNLTKSEVSEILLLQDICNLVDKTNSKPKLSTDLNINKSIPTFFLGREDDILVAFLTVFIPEGGIPEITSFVHPNYRRQRRFNQLFTVMKDIYKGYGIEEFMFIVNSQSLNGYKVIDSLGNLELHHREYLMELDKYDLALAENPLSIAEITKDMLPELSDALNECSDSYLMIDSFKQGIGSDDRTTYAAFNHKEPVGFFCIYHNDDSEEFYGESIRKSLRSKGLGKLMLDLAVKKALESGKKALVSIDSENAAAYHLYTSMGFKREQRTDYYIYKI